MNEFEEKVVDKVLGSLHEFELKVTQELAEIRGEIHAMREKSDSDNKALRELVENNIAVDTERLNKHSADIRTNSERLATIEEWKEQYQKQVAHRIAISQSISAVAAVVIAFLLSKFF